MSEAAADISSFEAMRHAMVQSQLRPSGVNDPRVVASMSRVAREDFVPPALHRLAYVDRALLLANGRRSNAPLATGLLLTAAEPQAGERVLLIGAAGGYTAAVLADLGAIVTAVESDPDLLALARPALAGLGRVTLVAAPLTAGCPDRAPYDLLVIDGAVEQLPDALADQLHPGGRIVAGLADRGVTRLASGRRTGGGVSLQAFADSGCVVLPGFAVPRGFSF